MLLFRSEEHIDRWTRQWRLERGAAMSLSTGWALARAWFTDRRQPDWRRRTAEETAALLASLGLSGAFWNVRGQSGVT
jgi:hypothetical protein